MDKSQLRGLIFELFCRYLVEMNGYKLSPNDNRKVFYDNPDSLRNIRMVGRGTSHQIDLPYDYKHDIPLINPIRLIGEVKCFSDRYPVQIKHIRDFYGVIEDIRQNYFFAEEETLPMEGFRKSEQALFISASGFTLGAQKFALAHNIKLLSFGNSETIKEVKEHTRYLADMLYEMYKSHTINKDELNQILDDLFISKRHSYQRFPRIVQSDYLSNKFLSKFSALSDRINSFRSTFLGTTSQGQLMLFISNDEFPIHLFNDGNERTCAIYYSYNEDGIDGTIRLVLNDYNGNIYEFFSTIPIQIVKDFEKEHNQNGNAINSKYNYFSPITLIKNNKILKITFNEMEFRQNNLEQDRY